MLSYILQGIDLEIIRAVGMVVAFIGTCLLLKQCDGLLPKDGGRDFAHDGKKSAGKPRGAGFIFILVFAFVSLLFVRVSNEIIIYIILTGAAMMTGFLDDCSRSPWGEYKKGMLDLVIAIMVAITYLNFNTNNIVTPFINTEFTLSPILFGGLTIALVWVSINVTNCSDGVDGLSGTLSIISLITIYMINYLTGTEPEFNEIVIVLIVCILAYLWFNATPSQLMMGDAGSRALGLFISIAILKTGRPLLYIPIAALLIVDGGLGLVKVILLRFFKIRILKGVRTPIHDHVRKNLEWSNTQVVFRFAILQAIISLLIISTI